MLKRYFIKIGWKRIFVMLLGNIFLGMGVSIFKLAGLGNDAYNGMAMALADCVGIPYGSFFVIISLGLFVVQFLTGRSFIGFGTIINTFFLGYITTFFYNLWGLLFPAPNGLPVQILVMLAGVIVCSFGVSMYQTPAVGVSPYDSLSLIMAKRFVRIPYIVCRVFTDALCALICFVSGGLVGLGTLAAALGLGPFIQFFNVHFTEKLFKDKTW